MNAPLANVAEMFHKWSGPKDATNVAPALTNNRIRGAIVAPDSHTQIAPDGQPVLRVTRLEMGGAFYCACADGKLDWGAVQGTDLGRYGVATGFVYFATIGYPKPTHIKIGYTKGNPDKRIASLQTGCPFSIALVQTIAGNPEMERDLNGFLAPWRVSGEWFVLEPQMKRMLSDFWNEPV